MRHRIFGKTGPKQFRHFHAKHLKAGIREEAALTRTGFDILKHDADAKVFAISSLRSSHLLTLHITSPLHLLTYPAIPRSPNTTSNASLARGSNIATSTPSRLPSGICLQIRLPDGQPPHQSHRASDPAVEQCNSRRHIGIPSTVLFTMSQLSFMQLQTQSSLKRPFTGGHSLSSSSTDSSVTLSSSANSGPSTSKTSCDLDIVRCSRCQRSLTIDPSGRSNNAIRFGMNSFYCQRCATVVGYK